MAGTPRSLSSASKAALRVRAKTLDPVLVPIFRRENSATAQRCSEDELYLSSRERLIENAFAHRIDRGGFHVFA